MFIEFLNNSLNFCKYVPHTTTLCYNKCTNTINTVVILKKGERVLIIIDYNDKRPIYEQIIDRFQTLILNGVLEQDSQLPSVRNLAIELSINANTIQRAYSELEREGYIYSVKGRGNFVRANESLLLVQKERLLKELKEHISKCQKAGISSDDIAQTINEFMEVAK